MGNYASSSTPSPGRLPSATARLLPLLLMLGTFAGSSGQAISAPARRLQADLWTQIGQFLNGEAYGDTFGRWTTISGDGNTLAVGAMTDDLGGLVDAGSVKVFRYNATSDAFDQLGAKIEGGKAYDILGATALSVDGTVLAVGAPRDGSYPGFVRLYRWEDGSSDWVTSAGSLVVGPSPRSNGDLFGRSIDLSADGSILAVGIPWRNDFKQGAVQLYNCTSLGVCSELEGLLFEGDVNNNYFGWYVSLSDDGSILAVGAHGNNQNGANAGKVKVFECDIANTSCVQKGSEILGSENDMFGVRVELSGNGETLAVGAMQAEGTGGPGYVKVFSYVNGDYAQVGDTLDGNIIGDSFGISLGVSADGGILVVGAQQQRGGTNVGDGYVQVYAFNDTSGSYQELGDAIPGLGSGGDPDKDRFGWDVSLSDDGATVAGASIWSAVPNGRSGQVRVFRADLGSHFLTGPGPWKVNFLGLSADLGVDSDEELVLDYEIGKDRDYETVLLEGDCSTNITGPIDKARSDLSPKNNSFQLLTLAYDVNKTLLANSTMWNSAASQMELCQIVRLIETTDNDLRLVIFEDKRVVTIGVDLTVNYRLNTTLGPGAINNATGLVDVGSYIEAFKCSGTSFEQDESDFAPGTQLKVCVKSTSSDVLIDELKSMDVTQDDTDMDVVNDGAVMIPSIASMTYSQPMNGVMVSTFVPSNLFEYSQGNDITISGVVMTRLAGGSGRRLQANDLEGNIDADDESPFSIKVGLKGEVGRAGDHLDLMNSAILFTGKGVIALSIILMVSYSMW